MLETYCHVLKDDLYDNVCNENHAVSHKPVIRAKTTHQSSI